MHSYIRRRAAPFTRSPMAAAPSLPFEYTAAIIIIIGVERLSRLMFQARFRVAVPQSSRVARARAAAAWRAACPLASCMWCRLVPRHHGRGLTGGTKSVYRA